MAHEFIVRVTSSASQQASPRQGEASSVQYRVPRLPITFGRNPENDIRVMNAFVSGVHARLEEVGGQVCVRDLDSRNGVYVRQGAELVRIRPGTPHELSRTGYEFQLGTEIRVHVEAPAPAAARPAIDARAIAPNFMNLADGASLPSFGDGLPPLPELARPLPDLPPLPGGGGIPGGLASDALSLPPLPAPAGARESRDASAVPPRAAPAPAFAPVHPAARGAPAEPSLPDLRTGNFDLAPPALALQGLRELLASLAPGQTLETTGDIARLITRLHDTLEVLCRSFIALRDTYGRFASNLELGQSAAYAPARLALETAPDARALASRLLDVREGAPDSSAALEEALLELTRHPVAFLDGVMQGVRALLEELSPESIELGGEAQRGPSERSSWEEYCRRHARLSDDGEAFARVFGAEFAAAYRRYRRAPGQR